MSRAALLFAAAIAAGCVRYRPSPVDPEATVLEAPAPPRDPLSYDDAVRWAMDHNPDLLALRARAMATRASTTPEPPKLEAGADSDRNAEVSLALDALSLLGLGRRGADRVLARARHAEARMEHHARAREIAGAIAEAYETERVLAALPFPELAFDPAAYVRAGLAPPSAEAVARGAAAAMRAEREAREAIRRGNRLALARLLGAAPAAELAIVPPEGAWPRAPEGDWREVLRARADLQRRLASYEVAEATFRRAVAEQYPALLVRPAAGGNPVELFGSVGITLPLGASRDARAAEAARDAARFELQGAVLDAVTEAEAAAHEAVAADSRLVAARERRAAQEEIVRTARAELEARAGSFLDVAFAVEGVVDAAREEREAALDEVRARLRAARARGWPGPPAAAERR